MRILLIDDHRLFREALAHVLADLDGHPTVVEAATVEDALVLAKRYHELDLILLDLEMPGMGGLSGIGRLADIAPTVPIVIVSASESIEDIRKAVHAGAAGYIPKTESGRDELKAALELVSAGRICLPKYASGLIESLAERAPERSRERPLTPRQLEVLRLIADGLSNKAIAKRLGLTEGTVKLHVSATLRALNSLNRTDAVVEAMRRRLLKP